MRFIFILTLLLCISLPSIAQHKITEEDYSRAAGLLPEKVNDNKLFNAYVRPHWFPDSTGVWYMLRSPEVTEYRMVALPSLATSPLFDHERLAQLLSDSLDHAVDPANLTFSSLDYVSSTELSLAVDGKNYRLNTSTYTLSPEPLSTPENNLEQISPDSQWIAYAEDYNLYLKSTTTGEVRQLSTDGQKDFEYASWIGWADIMEGENGDRPERFSVRWSDDGEWIYTNVCDTRTAQKMYLLDWSIDTLYRPRLLSYYRGSPGDTDMVYMEPVFFHIPTGKEIRPALPRSTHINSIRMQWSDTPGRVYLMRQERGYQKLDLYQFDLASEKLTTLYTESSKTNIDNFSHLFAEESDRLFFMSEKSGWRQLYALDLNNGQEIMLTESEYFVHYIEKIDHENEVIYFMASGREKGSNPYNKELYSISFDGSNLKRLTSGKQHHRVSISPDGKYFWDNSSTVNTATTTVLRSLMTGDSLLLLSQAMIAGMSNWSPPEVFTALAGDGKTTLYGALWKPTDFDSTQTYPVIEMSYTGPHTQVFPTSYSRVLSLQNFAELGFIALLVDGRGSSGRSKAFHDYSYKNLGGTLGDHVTAIKQLGRRHSWIDTTRVGIFGHSAGGYDAAHALLAYPDFYKVAVASSADHDHRMEKAWWPEMYMGWPVDSAYHLQSNITMAGNLKGKLLVTHGGIDDNVNPSATFKLAEALIKADKQFDMLILPSQQHGYRGHASKYFTKLRWNYFVEHLRGVEPIWDFSW